MVLSLIGKLRWFSNCLWAGPAFVRKLEEAANRKKNGFRIQWIRVNQIRDDLIWWKRAILHCEDGVSFEDVLRDRAKGDIHIKTDASTGDGMGGWCQSGSWFRYKWQSHRTAQLFSNPKLPDIYWKEMCAIATACSIWGDRWSGKAVTFWCDNEACVYSIAKRCCSFRRPDVMALIRIIADLSNRWKFRPYILHIKGMDNLTADALSRFDLRKFHEDTKGFEMAVEASHSELQLSDLVMEYVSECDLMNVVLDV